MSDGEHDLDPNYGVDYDEPFRIQEEDIRVVWDVTHCPACARPYASISEAQQSARNRQNNSNALLSYSYSKSYCWSRFYNQLCESYTSQDILKTVLMLRKQIDRLEKTW